MANGVSDSTQSATRGIPIAAITALGMFCSSMAMANPVAGPPPDRSQAGFEGVAMHAVAIAAYLGLFFIPAYVLERAFVRGRMDLVLERWKGSIVPAQSEARAALLLATRANFVSLVAGVGVMCVVYMLFGARM